MKVMIGQLIDNDCYISLKRFCKEQKIYEQEIFQVLLWNPKMYELFRDRYTFPYKKVIA